MGPAKRTLAIVALTTTLVSCTSPEVPASTSMAPPQKARIYSTTAVYPLAVDLVAGYAESDVLIEADIHSGNFALMMRQLLEDETAYLFTIYVPAGAELWAAPVGQDAIAIISHPAVSLDNLTLQQLRAIYQGRITNWSQLGGEDQQIILFGREAGSGTRKQFELQVMGRRTMTASALLATSSQQMMARVAETPGSLGYVAKGVTDDRVQLVAVEGVVPSSEMIAAGIYPLRTTVYVIGAEEPDETMLAFFAWIQSLEGQQIVGRSYVPLNMPGSD